MMGGPAWAQEDPCAPGPDGSVPEMCQSGMPVSDTGTVGMEPEPVPGGPCLGLPVEPGDGVVTEPDPGEGGAVTEPTPDEPTSGGERVDPQQTDPAQVDPATVDDTGSEGEPAPDAVICAFGIPVADGAPESATGGGGTVVRDTTVRDATANGAVSAGQLPRTGPYDQALALAALGTVLVLSGAAASTAGRRRA